MKHVIKEEEIKTKGCVSILCQKHWWSNLAYNELRTWKLYRAVHMQYFDCLKT